ncbi:MAG: class II fructose-1,6-bisphosphate aldolase [Mycoplasma sp.]|nr:class II fructose-1,6-bisphosphate aldolase [Mycoplasma sp.]
MSRLVNLKEMTRKAFDGHYAVAHININNLEWTKTVLLTSQANNSPVILGTSEGAVKYMGGYVTIANMVEGLMEYLDITVPVALHLDHGSYEGAKEALAAGYSSVMFDGSHFPLEENLSKTKEIVELAKKTRASVEAEIGTLAGEEDGVVGGGELATPEEAKLLMATGIDILAAGINNIHGPYPEGWQGLRFDVLESIREAVNMPLVLHGGSGIPKDQIKRAIGEGVSKINVNTELQLAFAAATRKYIEEGMDQKGKGYDPRKLLSYGVKAMEDTVTEKQKEFGCFQKA